MGKFLKLITANIILQLSLLSGISAIQCTPDTRPAIRTLDETCGGMCDNLGICEDGLYCNKDTSDDSKDDKMISSSLLGSSIGVSNQGTKVGICVKKDIKSHRELLSIVEPAVPVKYLETPPPFALPPDCVGCPTEVNVKDLSSSESNDVMKAANAAAVLMEETGQYVSSTVPKVKQNELKINQINDFF